MTKDTHYTDIPDILRYLGDDFPRYYQFLVENPPFFKVHTLRAGNYTLKFRYDISDNCAEELIDYVEHGWAANKDVNPYVYLEICKKKKIKKRTNCIQQL